MGEPFIGSEAVAAGRLSPYALRSKFVALAPDVYLPGHAEVDARIRAKVAWLWSRRQGILAGRSAAALHGARGRQRFTRADHLRKPASSEEHRDLG